MLPSMKRWPFRGYTFCTWLRIESLEDPTGLGSFYHPTLYRLVSSLSLLMYSFLTDDGFGLEASFSDHRLKLRILVRGRPGKLESYCL